MRCVNGDANHGALWAFAISLGCLREAMLLAAWGFALSGLDDMLVDSIYFARRLARGLLVRPLHPHVGAEAMGTDDPGWFAVFVPAWDESAVIGAMLRGLLAAYDYPRYRVFVGCYPNDAATIAAAEAVADARLQCVLTRRPGPTTKADCLNHLWRAAIGHEIATGIRFKAVVLHDAEDVVHAQELRVFDHLIGRFALVQLPVLPIADPDVALGFGPLSGRVRRKSRQGRGRARGDRRGGAVRRGGVRD